VRDDSRGVAIIATADYSYAEFVRSDLQAIEDVRARADSGLRRDVAS
jgi:hypothetical protein